jgi:hydrogenase maturation protease
MDSAPRTRLLVIGYGSTLRGDDAAGPRVAEAVDQLQLPGVRALMPPLLTPELAAETAQAETVVFVDATAAPAQEVRLEKLKPSPSSQLLGHAADPAILLALTRDVFGSLPHAWLLTIPVKNFAIGEGLSEQAQRGVAEAIRQVRALASTG